jgi:hypothetical protein
MPLAVKIYWFYRDNCCKIAPISQIQTKLNDTDFVNDILTDLFNTATRCQHDIAKLIDPEGFELTVYNDLVELHNRAVDLYNALATTC